MESLIVKVNASNSPFFDRYDVKKLHSVEGNAAITVLTLIFAVTLFRVLSFHRNKTLSYRLTADRQGGRNISHTDHQLFPDTRRRN